MTAGFVGMVEEVEVGAGPALGLLVLLAGVVLVVAVAFVAGLLVGRLVLRRPAPVAPPAAFPEVWPEPFAEAEPYPDAEPWTAAPADPVAEQDVDGVALALGVIAAYDLAATDGDRARLERALRRSGVTMILVQPGQEFDSRTHNAVATRTGSSDDGASGPAAPGGETVTDVVRPGWQAGGRVLRPADVTVTEHGPRWSASADGSRA